MILDDIKTALEAVKPRVYYGIVDASVKDTKWDYIVFNRLRRKTSQNKTGYSYYFAVHIISENFIPEDIDIEVTNKMLEIDGMKLADLDGEYTYVQKPNTGETVEMLTLYFVKARKAN